MRGFHGCIESTYTITIMKGFKINYNFVRKHLTLNEKIPAEVAILNLDLGKNKWLDLIKMSKV